MKKLSAEAIIKSYTDMVRARGGVPIGERVFGRESGIPRYNWMGGYWRSWSAFQEAAGFSPNDATQKIPDEVLLRRFAELAVERGAIPTEADLNLKRKTDPSFPGKLVFRRWGGRDALVTAAIEFCEANSEFESALAVLREGSDDNLNRRLASLDINGFVYLLRSGKHFKIGRTNAAGRRVRELAIQLPQRPDTVHVIETDDPEGIERYWHERFAAKRQGGEWFALTSEDVRAFKKRKFQ
jgi:hypothetical protein